eukprot:1158004-Pelagomonas_calceolata.AAC.12
MVRRRRRRRIGQWITPERSHLELDLCGIQCMTRGLRCDGISCCHVHGLQPRKPHTQCISS